MSEEDAETDLVVALGETLLKGALSGVAGKAANSFLGKIFGSDGKLNEELSEIEEGIEEIQASLKQVTSMLEDVESTLQKLIEQMGSDFTQLEAYQAELSLSKYLTNIHSGVQDYQTVIRAQLKAAKITGDKAARDQAIQDAQADWSTFFNFVTTTTQNEVDQIRDALTGSNMPDPADGLLSLMSILGQRKLGTSSSSDGGSSDGGSGEGLFAQYQLMESYYCKCLRGLLTAYGLIGVAYQYDNNVAPQQLVNAHDNVLDLQRTFRNAVYELVLSQYSPFPEKPIDRWWDIPKEAHQALLSLGLLEAAVAQAVTDMHKAYSDTAPPEGRFIAICLNQSTNLLSSVAATNSDFPNLWGVSHENYASGHYHCATLDPDHNFQLANYSDSFIHGQRFSGLVDLSGVPARAFGSGEAPPSGGNELYMTANPQGGKSGDRLSSGAAEATSSVGRQMSPTLRVVVVAYAQPICSNAVACGRVLKPSGSSSWSSNVLTPSGTLHASSEDHSGSGQGRNDANVDHSQTWELAQPRDAGSGQLQLRAVVHGSTSEKTWPDPSTLNDDPTMEASAQYVAQPYSEPDPDPSIKSSFVGRRAGSGDPWSTEWTLDPSWNRIVFGVSTSAYVDGQGQGWYTSPGGGRYEEPVDLHATASATLERVEVCVGWAKEDPPSAPDLGS